MIVRRRCNKQMNKYTLIINVMIAKHRINENKVTPCKEKKTRYIGMLLKRETFKKCITVATKYYIAEEL